MVPSLSAKGVKMKEIDRIRGRFVDLRVFVAGQPERHDAKEGEPALTT
jgi:hypothetical protein